MRSREHISNEFLFRQAEVYKDLFDSRGIPHEHEKEFDFMRKHKLGVRRLTGMLMKKGEVLGTFPDIVETALGIEEDMQANAHCKRFNYEIHSRRKDGDNLPKELVVYCKRKP